MQGGEFILRLSPGALEEITTEVWRHTLEDMVLRMKQHADDHHAFDLTHNKKYAFQFVDPFAKTDKGRPKAFRISWDWGPNAIENSLSGRPRTDYSIVVGVCWFLCRRFPGQLALILCGGITGYENLNFIYDGWGTVFKILQDYQLPWATMKVENRGNMPRTVIRRKKRTTEPNICDTATTSNDMTDACDPPMMSTDMSDVCDPAVTSNDMSDVGDTNMTSNHMSDI